MGSQLFSLASFVAPKLQKKMFFWSHLKEKKNKNKLQQVDDGIVEIEWGKMCNS